MIVLHSYLTILIAITILLLNFKSNFLVQNKEKNNTICKKAIKAYNTKINYQKNQYV